MRITPPNLSELAIDQMVAGDRNETVCEDGSIWLSYSASDGQAVVVQATEQRAAKCENGKVQWRIAFAVPEPQFAAVFRVNTSDTPTSVVRVFPSDLRTSELPDG